MKIKLQRDEFKSLNVIFPNLRDVLISRHVQLHIDHHQLDLLKDTGQWTSTSELITHLYFLQGLLALFAHIALLDQDTRYKQLQKYTMKRQIYLFLNAREYEKYLKIENQQLDSTQGVYLNTMGSW